ncbi:TNF receptor-associated factor 2-like [Saccoglossus kowalevskii]|uniref:TNF receptor-associated factor 2-like n=1 Tax=Saccoglossus kowalevskii TaxID=10224 RepID=A0ABM0MLE6_SACKO|nr:PREDICTED: TNF receptor-associated factor 2-like [Saccoglossus kowalevskii]
MYLDDLEPNNNTLTINTVFPDRALAREMMRLKVRCVYNGCVWSGYYSQYKDHAMLCDFGVITCPVEGCGQEIQRGNRLRHTNEECCMRKTTCQYCNNDYIYRELKVHHAQCPKVRIPCDWCGNRVLREKIADHKNTETGDCPNMKQICEFKQVGCSTLIEKNGQSAHNKQEVQHHAHLLLQAILKLDSIKDNIKEYSTQIQQIKTLLESQKTRIQSLTQTTGNLEDQMRQHGQQLAKQNIRTEEKELGNDKQYYINELRAHIVKLEKKVETYEAIVSVLSREAECTTDNLTVVQRQSDQFKEQIRILENNCKSQDRIIALKDVSLAEQDLRIQALEMTSYDGILLWKITDFARKRRDAISGRKPSIYSPYFFTSHHGYKLCARLYLNGDGMGKGNHVSLFFVVMKGEYDAILKWPFRLKVTLMWLDQSNREHVIDAFRPDPSSSSFKRPTGDMNIASGCPLFMPLSVIDSGRCEYVKDDTAFIRIIVDVTDLG